MRPTAEADLGRAVDVLTEPGAFLAFSNGDCGLNNYLIGRTTARSSISSSPAIATCSPTWPASMCRGRSGWRSRRPSQDGTEDAYRSILAPVLRQVADDAAYGQGVSAAGLLFALLRLGRLHVLDARPPGHGAAARWSPPFRPPLAPPGGSGAYQA